MARKPRDYAAERARRDVRAQAMGYKSYNSRAHALKQARQKGNFSLLRGTDAANPKEVLKKGQNVSGVAKAKLNKDGKVKGKTGTGRRSVNAILKAARAAGAPVEVRYVLDGRSGEIDRELVLDPPDVPASFDGVVSIIEADAHTIYEESSWDGAVLSFTVRQV